MSPTANYAEAKRRAAAIILEHPAFDLLQNPEPVHKAAVGAGDRDTMFNLRFAKGGLQVTVGFYHDFGGRLPPSCQDEAGNVLQPHHLSLRVSWPALDKAHPLDAGRWVWLQQQVVDLADAVNLELQRFGLAWSVIQEAPARVSRDEGQAA